MKNKSNPLFDSTGSTIFAVLIFLFSFGMTIGGLFVLLRSFFMGGNQYLQGALITSTGLTLIVGVYNIILYFEAIKRLSELAMTQAEVLKSIQSKNQNPFGSILGNIAGITAIDGTDPDAEPKHFNSIPEMMDFLSRKRNPGAPPIQHMSDEELATEKDKALKNQEYERAAMLRDELIKRKSK